MSDYLCPCLAHYSHQMPYKIIGRETFFCLCFFVIFEVETLTSTSLSPLSSHLTLLPSPSLWLSNQIHLSSSLGQSHHIQTRGRSEEGDRRRRDHLWDIGLSDRHTSWYCKEGDEATGLTSTYLSWIPRHLPELDIIHDCRCLKNDDGLKEQAFMVLKLLSVLCHWPFFSASLSDLTKEELGALVNFFTGSICLHLATFWAIDWCDCIITAGYRYVYRTRITIQWFAVLLWYISTAQYRVLTTVSDT